MNHLSKSFIILFSELIWIYYLVALLTLGQWDIALFVNMSWWIAAVGFGYILNTLIIGRIHYVPVIILNFFVISVIIIQNWRLVVPEGSLIFGIIISVIILFIFLRSANLAFKEQTRRQMLYRFEGNIIFYAIFAFVFIDNEIFHTVFLFAIFISLMGMVLTLQNHVQDDNNSNIEVHKVGRSGWFTAIIGLLLACITIASFLLFLPSVRQTLQSMGTAGFAGLQWLYNQLITFLMWLFSLFPNIESEGEIEGMGPEGAALPEEVPEELLFSLPQSWLIAGGIVLGVIIIGVIIWIASRFLKQWKPPARTKEKRLFTFKGSWWKQLKKSFLVFVKRIQVKWYAKFQRFYKEPIYWYYYKVQKWAKKNGINRALSETSKEYMEKIIAYLHELTAERLSENDKKQLISGLRKMNLDYQATYYGYQKALSVTEYKRLTAQLNSLKINKRITKKVLKP